MIKCLTDKKKYVIYFLEKAIYFIVIRNAHNTKSDIPLSSEYNRK